MNKAEQIEILMEYKEYLVDEITMLLRESRQEPGISIIEMSKIIKGVYAPCEVESLIKELK